MRAQRYVGGSLTTFTRPAQGRWLVCTTNAFEFLSARLWVALSHFNRASVNRSGATSTTCLARPHPR